MPAYKLFANTGVQIICVPLRNVRYTSSQVGYGWQYCRCMGSQPKGAPQPYHYIQWQIIPRSDITRLYLAVDTSCGDPEEGYFCDQRSLARDFHVSLEGLLDLEGNPLKGLPPIELVISPASATSGDPRHVHMVVDFGNSRTGALLLEVAGEITLEPRMLPLELLNRYMLDSWDHNGEYQSRPANRWFPSKTHWCTTPYLPPEAIRKTEYHTVEPARPGLFGWGKPKQQKSEKLVTPRLFDDLSMVRMGREAEDMLRLMHAEGDIRTGVSSPKRYLWADDDSWLEGANWHMADPANRYQTGNYVAVLQGPLLKYIHEDDRDFLLFDEEPAEDQLATEVPLKPRHPPRALMTAALYELLCQAYMYVNSVAYREATGDVGRAREIRTLTLSYPSGMIQEERQRLEKQAQKAVNIFARTLGKNQAIKPQVRLGIDEASAVHLTYIWSQLRMLGQDPRIWFSTVRQDRGHAPPEPRQVAEVAAPAGARRGVAPELGSAVQSRSRPQGNLPGNGDEIRIACIDVGGGTTDLMIARYTLQPGIDDKIWGEVLHQDGINLGGDQLVKRLLECIIVPRLTEAIGLEPEDVQLLFGPEVPRNREIRLQRIRWMNHLLVPLALAYLARAVEELPEEVISHTNPDIVDPEIIKSLQDAIDKLRGPGYCNVSQELNLYFDKAAFEKVAHEVFDELLYDFCRRICHYRADVVLLAGLPSKLSFIQQLVRTYVPLAPSRVLPMHNHYAGNWYPYQDDRGLNPGVIVDPKSPVAVGAAIELLASHGMLPQFKFKMQPRNLQNSYYWGVMSDATSGIRSDRILFSPASDQIGDDVKEVPSQSQRMLIGRKLSPDEYAQATPAYLVKVITGGRYGEVDIRIRLRRKRATKQTEECLTCDAVTGTVAGEPAVLGQNVLFVWRTLADERYYLDTGALDNIELPSRR